MICILVVSVNDVPMRFFGFASILKTHFEMLKSLDFNTVSCHYNSEQVPFA